MKTFESTYRLDTQANTVRYATEEDVSRPYRYKRRNYMSTSFIQPVSQFAHGQYQLSFNNQPCQPCQPCQSQCQPIIIPVQCQQPYQEESDCECEQLDQYKQELTFLRNRVSELLNREPEVRIVKETVTDTARVNELEIELQRTRLTLQQEQTKLRTKDDEIYDLRQKLQRAEQQNEANLQGLRNKITELEAQLIRYRTENERLAQLLKQSQDRVTYLESQYDEMSQTQVYEYETTITNITRERDDWKLKYKEHLNDYYKLQEDFMHLQVQLEALQKSKVEEIRDVKVERRTVQNTTGGQTVSSSSRVVSQPAAYSTSTYQASSTSYQQPTSDSVYRAKEGTASRIYP